MTYMTLTLIREHALMTECYKQYPGTAGNRTVYRRRVRRQTAKGTNVPL